MNKIYSFLTSRTHSQLFWLNIVAGIIGMFLISMLVSCANESRAAGMSNPNSPTLASVYGDSLTLKPGEFYVTEFINDVHVVANHPVKDANEVVGSYTKNANTYNVRKGSKGGLYIWRIKGARAQEPGSPYKDYLNELEKAKVDY